MSILKSIDNLSYGKILSVGFVMAIAISLPISILLVQQQTKLSSSAHIDRPTVTSIANTVYGSPAAAAIEVNRVYPFLGKSGDEVVILGKNFGTNPQDKQFVIGLTNINQENINVWQDNMITLTLPGEIQSGIINIKSGSFTWTSKLPFIIYNEKTQTQVKKSGDTLTIISPNPNITKVAYNTLGSAETSAPIKMKSGIFNFPVPTGEIDHLVLYDVSGNLIPFYVSPIEFDF
jgi:hypothetical protein